MDTCLIELTNNNASRLLKDLEDLNIIKILRRGRDQKDEQPAGNAGQFRGELNLSDEQYKDFQTHSKNIRGEWPKSI